MAARQGGGVGSCRLKDGLLNIEPLASMQSCRAALLRMPQLPAPRLLLHHFRQRT